MGGFASLQVILRIEDFGVETLRVKEAVHFFIGGW